MKNIQLLFSILADEGFDIHFATNGKAALKHLEERSVDIILLDIMMPEMDGFTVCKKLKENERTRHIPVIFLTAKTDAEDKVRGLSLGAVDYMTKPFHGPEVLARIRNQLKIIDQQKTIQVYNEKLAQMLEERTRELIRTERQAVFGQLVQGIVHNLKNPLASAMMSAQMITDSFEKVLDPDLSQEDKLAMFMKMKDRVENAVDFISLSHETLDKMISSLLVKSRMDSTEKEVVFDLNELVKRELEFLQADLEFKHNVEKVVEMTPLPATIQMAPGNMSQVLQNLIRNALDAMYATKEARIRIETRRIHEHIQLKISDNGPGIDQAIIDQIFDPFFTTKPLATESSDDEDTPRGTGLGLWICKQMITTAGGNITVLSEPGQGTTFTITLPLAR